MRCCPTCGLPLRSEVDKIIDGLKLEPCPRVVLMALAQKLGHCVRKDQLIAALYGMRPDGGPLYAHEVLGVHICKIRKVLPVQLSIETVWGIGYRLEWREPVRSAA